MRYLFSDLKSYFKNNIIYLHCIFLFFIFILYGYMKNSLYYSYLNVLGLDILKTSNYIEMSMYYYNILFTIFLTIYIFIKNLKYSINNLFLRMDLKKWIIYLILKILFILIIPKIISHFIISLFVNVNIIIFITNLYKDIIFTVSISLLSILVFIFHKRIHSIFLLLLIMVLFKINVLSANIYILLIIIFIEIVLLLWFFSNKKNYLFENINGGLK